MVSCFSLAIPVMACALCLLLLLCASVSGLGVRAVFVSAIMAPKRAPRRGFPIVTDAVLRTVEAARAARDGRSAPYVVAGPPSPAADTALAQVAVSGCASSSSGPGPQARSDFAPIRHTRRGEFETALHRADQAGLASLVSELQTDREAASGRGGRQILVNTWAKFHAAASAHGSGSALGPLLPSHRLPWWQLRPYSRQVGTGRIPITGVPSRWPTSKQVSIGVSTWS